MRAWSLVASMILVSFIPLASAEEAGEAGGDERAEVGDLACVHVDNGQTTRPINEENPTRVGVEVGSPYFSPGLLVAVSIFDTQSTECITDDDSTQG